MLRHINLAKSSSGSSIYINYLNKNAHLHSVLRYWVSFINIHQLFKYKCSTRFYLSLKTLAQVLDFAILFFDQRRIPFYLYTLREECSQTNVILRYKLLAAILSAVCSVIQQSLYVLHFYYTLYDGKYDCKITTH